MSLEEIINQDLKNALKSHEENKVGVLRFLNAQIHNRKIEKRSSGKGDILSDEEVLDVLAKEAKKRRESIDVFRKNNREDLATKEEAEMEFLAGYLPKMLTSDEIESEVDKIIRNGVSDFSSAVKELMAKFKGKIDGRLATEIIKRKLGG